MMNFLVMISWFLMGGACAYHAKRRGRHPAAWFGIGLLFGIFGLILLLLLPPPKSVARASMFSTGTGRRSLFKKAMEQPEVQPSRGGSFLPPIAPEFEPLAKEHRMWYYLDEKNAQQGPMSIYLLQNAWQEGKVTRSTYVWNEEFEEWKALGGLLDASKPS
jgi:hypothetical protein